LRVSRNTLVIGALALATMASAARPPGAYYETSRLVLKLNGEPWSDDGIKKTLAATLGEVGMTAVVRAGPDGVDLPAKKQPETVFDLDPVEALACLTVASFPVRGAEVDLVLDRPEGPVPVTVWWDADALRVSRASRPWTPAPPDEGLDRGKSRLKALGVGELAERDRTWDAAALHRLQVAIEHLTPRERKVLDGLVFTRQHTGGQRTSPPPGMTWAQVSAAFAGGDGPQRIEVYDATLDERGRFVGPTNDPMPVAIFDLLHELGHAIARHDLRAIDAERLVLLERLEGIQARIKRLRSKGGAALNQAIEENNATVQHLQALDAQIVVRGDSPAVTELTRLLGTTPAPTPYGRTDPNEAFADAFALFHADPAALKRAAPKVHGWFAAGKHLEAVGM